MRGGDRRRRSLAAAALATALLPGLFGCASDQTPPERIVLIVVDTLRRDHLGCYGGETHTPHIDALAARGQRFEDALSSFHQTTMSMGALFTGRTPSLESGDPAQPLPWRQHTWCGMARFAAVPEGGGPCLPDSLPTLAERIRDAGYETLGVTSNALLFGEAGFRRGFAAWSEVGESGSARRSRRLRAGPRERREWAASRAGPRVNAAVSALLDRRRSDRFFLYVHYMDVHDYALRGVSYARGVEEVDRAVGELLDELERRGLLRDAVVVLASDHGERLGESHPVAGRLSHRGNPSFGPVLRVPLIVSPARLVAPEDPVRSEDLHRLLLEFAGAEGRPESDLARDELLVTEADWRTYRQGRWKSAWRRQDDRRLLFDLASDPDEQHDRSADHPDVLAQHGRRIATLASRLAARHDEADGSLSPAERERLRVLGYLDEERPRGGSAPSSSP